MNAKSEAMHAMKTNLEGNARHENKTLKATHAMNTKLEATHAVKTNFEGDTRHEYKLRRRHTP